MGQSAFFAKLRAARRVWAVAAIHGEAERLDRLQAQLGARFEPGDRLVYLGNYLGFGPAIRETVDALVAFRRELLARARMMACDIVYLRGSQEEMWDKLQQLQFAVNPPEVLSWMLERGVRATLEAYGGNADDALARARAGALALARLGTDLRDRVQACPGHAPLFASIRRAAYTEGGELAFVHAGIDPTRPLSTQDDALWWGADGFDRIDAPHEGRRKLVRGFDPAHKGFRIAPHTATIDAGCGFGGALKAVCFDLEGESVDALEG